MPTASGTTRHVRYAAVVAFIGLTAGFAALCLFTVETGEFAVVTQFGNPVRVVKAPGLHMKYP